MKKNIGTADKTLRIILGLGVISYYFWGEPTPWAFLGIIPLLTGFISYCPLYQVIGMNTCSEKSCCAHDEKKEVK